jgi:hypothetical protein
MPKPASTPKSCEGEHVQYSEHRAHHLLEIRHAQGHIAVTLQRYRNR